jgi:hypothetical protein
MSNLRETASILVCFQKVVGQFETDPLHTIPSPVLTREDVEAHAGGVERDARASDHVGDVQDDHRILSKERHDVRPAA